MDLRFLSYLSNKLNGGSTSPIKNRQVEVVIIPAKAIKNNPNMFIALDFFDFVIFKSPSLYVLIVMIVVE